LETPAGYILQGWQLSVPKPGQDPVRLGTPTDVKVVIMNAPPVETSQIKVVANLNANDISAFPYYEDDWAKMYADQKASPLAEDARIAAELAVYDYATMGSDYVNVSNKFNTAYEDYMTQVKKYTQVGTTFQANPTTIEEGLASAAATAAAGFDHGPYPSGHPVWNSTYEATMAGYLYNLVGTTFVKTPSATEVILAQKTARAAAEEAATIAGQEAKNRVYDEEYFDSYSAISAMKFPSWQLEGMGFASAWNGTDLSSPIDPEHYTHANPWTIYDSLGNSHTLMVYYQPNPYMENVWDYIITCDPTEDARKENMSGDIFMNGATFAGLIQKGKITFTADGPDGHGGLIKDIEAQNLDLSKTKIAKFEVSGIPVCSYPIVASSMLYVDIGGYYTGSPQVSLNTGNLEVSSRTYTITWLNHVGVVPQTSGFHWVDGVNSGDVRVYDKNYTGPYAFCSGLTLSFTKGGVPMKFTSGDSCDVPAKSEAIAWSNLIPNTEGYFDFDVAFVQSASMALHPPYPQGLPTIIQHIALDMGARKTNGQNGSWILDEQGTTQYATESINIFSSQDGYPAGSLQRVSIDKDGILTGIYTNGRHQPLYQIGLARFMNPWGLAKLGDNVYMETRWSGTASLNPPGYGGTGTVRANFLEQSNTDLADEIVNMIVTQRGFQANSKVVTTTDTMLAEVIEMKR